MPECRIAFLSDIHLRDTKPRLLLYARGLENIKNSRPPYDLFVSVGDLTDHGYKEHWLAAQKCTEKRLPAQACIFALGNHDTWNRHSEAVNEYDASLPYYIDFRRKFCNVSGEKPYFSRAVNGVPFIMLSTEQSHVDGFVTNEQIQWLEEELKKAAALHTFIFVISHWALKGTHGLPKTFGDKKYNEFTGSIGEQSDRIRELLLQYKNVIYISGHSHMGWMPPEAGRGYASFERLGDNALVNLPCYIFLNHDGLHNEPGIGLEAVLRGETLVLCPKNYALNRRYKKYEITLKLK